MFQTTNQKLIVKGRENLPYLSQSNVRVKAPHLLSFAASQSALSHLVSQDGTWNTAATMGSDWCLYRNGPFCRLRSKQRGFTSGVSNQTESVEFPGSPNTKTLNKGEDVPLSLSTISTESDSWVPQLITDGLSTAKWDDQSIFTWRWSLSQHPLSWHVMTTTIAKQPRCIRKLNYRKKKNDHLKIISFNS